MSAHRTFLGVKAKPAPDFTGRPGLALLWLVGQLIKVVFLLSLSFEILAGALTHH